MILKVSNLKFDRIYFSDNDMENITRKDVEIKDSLISGAGKGLFAKKDFKKGDIIGEYYGMIFGPNEEVPREHYYYIYEKTNKDSVAAAGSCLCRYINDAIDIKSCILHSLDELYLLESYEDHRLIKSVAKSALLCSENVIEDEDNGIICDYNVNWLEKDNKIYIEASRDVEEGEEFYIEYGYHYWIYTVITGIKKELLIDYLQLY